MGFGKICSLDNLM
jgi:hypothetical protein